MGTYIDQIRAHSVESSTISPDDEDDPLPNPNVSSNTSQPVPVTALRRSVRDRRLTYGPAFN